MSEQSNTYTTAQVIEIIRNQVCFVALRDGYCFTHRGKCGDLLETATKLERDADAKAHVPTDHEYHTAELEAEYTESNKGLDY
jgi:hypothetical protein